MKLISTEIGWLILVILIAVPFLFMRTIIDSIMFVVTLFNENTKNKQDCRETRSQHIFIDPEVFDILVNVIEISEEKVDVKEVILYFKERFRLIDQISALLFSLDHIEISDSKNKDAEEFKVGVESQNTEFRSYKYNSIDLNIDKKILQKYSPKDVINQYNAIKTFLLQNSIIDNQKSRCSVSQNDHSNSYYEKQNDRKTLGYILKTPFLCLINEMKDTYIFKKIVNNKIDILRSSERKLNYLN